MANNADGLELDEDFWCHGPKLDDKIHRESSTLREKHVNNEDIAESVKVDGITFVLKSITPRQST